MLERFIIPGSSCLLFVYICALSLIKFNHLMFAHWWLSVLPQWLQIQQTLKCSLQCSLALWQHFAPQYHTWATLGVILEEMWHPTEENWAQFLTKSYVGPFMTFHSHVFPWKKKIHPGCWERRRCCSVQEVHLGRRTGWSRSSGSPGGTRGGLLWQWPGWEGRWPKWCLKWERVKTSIKKNTTTRCIMALVLISSNSKPTEDLLGTHDC